MHEPGGPGGLRGSDTKGGRVAGGIGSTIGAFIGAVMAGEGHTTWLAIVLVIVAVLCAIGTVVAMSKLDN